LNKRLLRILVRRVIKESNEDTNKVIYLSSKGFKPKIPNAQEINKFKDELKKSLEKHTELDQNLLDFDPLLQQSIKNIEDLLVASDLNLLIDVNIDAFYEMSDSNETIRQSIEEYSESFAALKSALTNLNLNVDKHKVALEKIANQLKEGSI